MNEQQNIEVVKRGYEAFGTGDMLRPDAVGIGRGSGSPLTVT